MPKIAIIGAGGFVFPLLLIKDILAFESLQSTEFALYDIDLGRARTTLGGAETLIDLHGLGASASATDDPRAALDDADFVICAFQVGGHEAYSTDVLIPREYGIDQTVGDTLGPGGVFRGLRSIGALLPLVELMHEVCPEALLLQYANPMSINCWATEALGIRTVGLCHSVQHTSQMLAREIGVPYGDVTFDCAGVNHTSWFTTFRSGDEDLIPRIREVMVANHIEGSASGVESDDLHGGGTERVRTELMRLTGYFHTESSHHASEYWAWFRRTPEVVAQYISKRWDYLEISSGYVPEDRTQTIVDATRDGLVPSDEYGARIIDSIVSGTPRIIYGNVPNAGGLIDNLPGDAIVELACHVDANGLRPIRYGSLPDACAALNAVQINVQRLATRAALTGDRELVHAAVALDPLTGACATLPQIREMVDRMFDAQASWLPQFAEQVILFSQK